MTEKLLTGTLSLNTNKQNFVGVFHAETQMSHGREKRPEHSVVKEILKHACGATSFSDTPLFPYEPQYKKTCLQGFRPGKTQTGLLSYRE